MNNPSNQQDHTIYCDLCCLQPNGDLRWHEHATPAIVDGPTRQGAHAYMCERHLQSSGYPTSKMNHRLKQAKKEQE